MLQIRLCNIITDTITNIIFFRNVHARVTRHMTAQTFIILFSTILARSDTKHESLWQLSGHFVLVFYILIKKAELIEFFDLREIYEQEII